MEQPDQTVTQSEPEREQRRQQSASGPIQLDGYQLERRLGEGTFGEVWAGIQLRTGQQVAVKILRSTGPDSAYFRHEVERLRQVAEHPYVVTLLDADLKHEPPFFVMPWMAKGSLAGLKGPPTVLWATQWLREVAQGLCYTHEKGLLHCDLKPANVLVDDEDHVRLVDFGQACHASDGSGSLGTLGFMAPEQADLSPANVPNVRWDIYALGATFYQLLTGQCPRLTEDERSALSRLGARTALELYPQKLLVNPLVPLSQLNPAVDSDLCAIIEACLRLDPHRRTSTVTEVLHDLERRQAGEPLLCLRPWSTSYRLGKLLRKPAVSLTLTGVLLLLGMAGVSYRQIRVAYANEVEARSRLEQEKRRSDDRLAGMMIQRGHVAAQEGDRAQALLWWARVLMGRPGDRDLRLLLKSYRENPPQWEVEVAEMPTLGFSPDSRLVAVMEMDKGFRVLDLASGKTLTRQQLESLRWTFSSDGNWLATWGAFRKPAGPLSVWDTRSWQSFRLPAEVHRSSAVSFSESGELAVLEPTGRFRMWSLQSRSPVRTLSLAPSTLRLTLDLARNLALTGNASGVRIWSLDKGRPIGAILRPKLQDYTYDHQVGLLTTREGADHCDLWEIPSGRQLKAPWGQRPVTDVSFSPDGRTAATHQGSDKLVLLSRDSGTEVYSTNVFSAPAFSPDSRQALVRSAVSRMTRVGLPDGVPQGHLTFPDALTEVKCSPDGKWLLTSHGLPSHIQLRPLGGFAPREEVTLSGPAQALVYTPSGKLLVATPAGLLSRDGGQEKNLGPLAGREAGLCLLEASHDSRRVVAVRGASMLPDAHTTSTVLDLTGATSALVFPDTLVRLSPGGRALLLIPDSDKGPARIRSLVDGKETPLGEAVWGDIERDGEAVALSGAPGGPGGLTVRTAGVPPRVFQATLPNRASCVKLSPDGQVVACGDWMGHVGLWSVAQERAIRVPVKVGLGPIYPVIFSPDGKQLAVGCADGSVHVLSVRTGQELYPPLAHPGSEMTRLVYDATGHRLATVGRETGLTRVWDAGTGMPLTPWLDSGAHAHVALSADGLELAVASGKRLKIWDLSVDATIPAATIMQQVKKAGGTATVDVDDEEPSVKGPN